MIKQMFIGRTKILLFLSAVLLIFFLIIANPSLYFFLNDDFIHIPLVEKNDFLQGVFYRPLSNLSLWIDNKIWRQNAFGYHLTNVLIHLANCILIFFLGRKFFSFSSDSHLGNVKAALSALLFLIYAYHSESVFWIIGRGGSLASLFFLLALFFYLKSWSGIWFYYVASLLFFAAGLFTYEVIWCYPLIVVVFSLVFKPPQKQRQKIWGVAILFVLFLLLRIHFTKTIFSDYELGVLKGLHGITLGYKYNVLLARCFLPPMKNSSLFLIVYILLVIGLVIILFKFRKNKILVTAFCCLAVSILPVTQLGIDTHDSESERVIYMASVFAIFFLIELLFCFNRYVIQISFTLLVLFHAYELTKAADSYKFSSMVVKTSLECLHINTSDKIIAVNVPTQYRGALIFRTGLPEALQWFKGVKPDNVLVFSQKEIFNKFSSLNCFHFESKDLSQKDWLQANDSEDSLLYANRVFLKWNNDSLYVKRQ